MNLIKFEQNELIKYIEEFFEEPLLNDNLKNFIVGKSKRIRSTLALLYLKMYGVSITENIYNVLAAGEIIHNASLMHDDVIDDAENRRGECVIAKKYNANISILSGDYLLSFGIGKLLRTGNLEILEYFQQCAQRMTKSEIKQYMLRGQIPSSEEYISNCIGKTAELFGVILKSVALLSGLDVNDAYEFGKLFGLYFQINNDLEETSAKEDKKNSVMTAKDIYGIEKTIVLLDNYKGGLKDVLNKKPQNEYNKAIEELVEKI